MADILVPSNVVYVNQPLIKMTRQGGHRRIGWRYIFLIIRFQRITSNSLVGQKQLMVLALSHLYSQNGKCPTYYFCIQIRHLFRNLYNMKYFHAVDALTRDCERER